jgi:asparagine synthase (glutamine-hydrolysing)
MSGILGIYNLDDASVDGSDLTRMMERLTHRGKDGSGVWQEGGIALGHQMLWTTPESLLEQLPMQRQGLVITADARIDNREELLEALALHPAEKITDSDLILAAYEKWGEDCPEHLLGDFAFAIWDQRQQQLFCARDHFGIKPFYYYLSDQVFAFSSEIKALFIVPGVPQQLNEERVADYLLSQFDNTEPTFYRGILRLSPAHCLTATKTSIEINPYWSLDPHQERRLDSPEAYAQEFHQLFAEAVRCRMRSAFPIGAMLSGGLDSSSIACMADKLRENDRPIATFSAIFDAVPECDERAYINPVLAQGNFDPHYVYGDRISPLTDLDSVLWHQDQPLFSYNLYLNWSLYRVAQSQGTRVILDGFDGDSTVSHGIGYLAELAQTHRWLQLYQEIQGLNQNFEQQFKGVFPILFWRYGMNPLIAKILPLRFLQRAVNAIVRRVRNITTKHRQSDPPDWHQSIHPDFIQRLHLESRRKTQPIPKDLHAAKAEHYSNLVRGVMPYTLEVLDHAAAAFSIDLRFPFWDKRLIEFCLAIPPEQKIEKGWTRMIMRRAMAGILPQSVQWRGGKANLGAGFNYGFLTYERERLEAQILNDSENISSYFDLKKLRQTCQSFLNQTTPEGDISSVWLALNLSSWLHKTAFKNDHNRSSPMPKRDRIIL